MTVSSSLAFLLASGSDASLGFVVASFLASGWFGVSAGVSVSEVVVFFLRLRVRFFFGLGSSPSGAPGPEPTASFGLAATPAVGCRLAAWAL